MPPKKAGSHVGLSLDAMLASTEDTWARHVPSLRSSFSTTLLHLVSEHVLQPENTFFGCPLLPLTLAPLFLGAGLELSTAALEACLAESNSSLQQLQGHCDSLQARLNLVEAAHAADMEAMTQQLAEAAGSAASKEAVTR